MTLSKDEVNFNLNKSKAQSEYVCVRGYEMDINLDNLVQI